MNVKNMLVGLCGVWALIVGIRLTYLFAMTRTENIMHFSTPYVDLVFIFIPLVMLGLNCVIIACSNYFEDREETDLGGESLQNA